MPQQLPQIAIGRVGHPDSRKPIFDHQLQQQLRILAVGLLFSHPLGADLPRRPRSTTGTATRSADAQTSVRVRWLPSRYARSALGARCKTAPLLPGESDAVRRTPRFRVHKCNLLEARMIVTTYNQHVRLLSSEPLVGLRLQSLLGPGSRHCYGIITLIDPAGDDECNRLLKTVTNRQCKEYGPE